MTEQASQSDLQQILTTHQDHPVVSFPKIQAKRIATVKQPINKNMASLPALQNKQHVREQIRQLKMLKKAQHKREEQIVSEIQGKMKQVLEILNNGSSIQQNMVSDEVEFEDEIKLNKQRIKQAISSKERKLQKSHSKDSNSRSRHIDRYQNKNTLNLNKRSLSSYNHQISSKRENLKQYRKKSSLQMENRNLIQYKEKPIAGLPPKNNKKVRVQTSKPKVKKVSEPKQAQNVFDGIQNMLQNPKTHVQSIDSQGNKQQIEKLQKKLRLISQKLGQDDESQTKQSFMSEQLKNNTVHDWKRLSYNGGRFVCHRDSNFEKQIEKVIRLQQQNNLKIGDFVNNQLELINLNYIKRACSQMKKKE